MAYTYEAKNMPFRRLGPSGLRVPVFSLGACAWLIHSRSCAAGASSRDDETDSSQLNLQGSPTAKLCTATPSRCARSALLPCLWISGLRKKNLLCGSGCPCLAGYHQDRAGQWYQHVRAPLTLRLRAVVLVPDTRCCRFDTAEGYASGKAELEM